MADALKRHLQAQDSTPQSEPIPGREEDMKQNNAGGFSFKLDKWEQFRRFLILGTEGGTYYVGERQLTAENTKIVEDCINEDGVRALTLITEISEGGYAPKNTQAIYALAVAVSAPDESTRYLASRSVGRVCRTGTHLYQYTDFVKQMGVKAGKKDPNNPDSELYERGRGSGPLFRKSISNVLTETPTQKLALHAVKYRQREGWTYRDLLRLSHAKTDEEDRNVLFGYMAGKRGLDEIAQHESLRVVEGYLRMQVADTTKEAVRLIEEYKLPWEAVPDKFRKEPQVWEAILPNMGATALVRNISAMTRIGMLTPLGSTERFIVGRLSDADYIARSREHPIRFLDAMLVHRSGGRSGMSRGEGYTPNGNVVDALEGAFQLAFGNVEPTGKRHYLALDVSGSMRGGVCGGSALLSPRDGSAAMALITGKVEQNTFFGAFTSRYSELNFTRKSTFGEAVAEVSGKSFGGTDCAKPMEHALTSGMEVDIFVIYTDNETWAGHQAPSQALRKYREGMGIDAKLAVVGMTATDISIADPKDGGMLDFVGFDASTPKALSLFAAG